jgi:hypothetical protein
VPSGYLGYSHLLYFGQQVLNHQAWQGTQGTLRQNVKLVKLKSNQQRIHKILENVSTNKGKHYEFMTIL